VVENGIEERLSLARPGAGRDQRRLWCATARGAEAGERRRLVGMRRPALTPPIEELPPGLVGDRERRADAQERPRNMPDSSSPRNRCSDSRAPSSDNA
jgi:hypothetical protein